VPRSDFSTHLAMEGGTQKKKTTASPYNVRLCLKVKTNIVLEFKGVVTFDPVDVECRRTFQRNTGPVGVILSQAVSAVLSENGRP